MTREEKIDWLCSLRSNLDVWMPEMNKYKKMYKQVLSEAIEVLYEPTKTDNIAEYEKAIKDIKAQINSNNRGSCDYFIVDEIEKIVNKIPTKTDTKSGTIDKGKVLDILIKHDNEICSDTFDEMWKEVDALPFIEPTRPKAKWISVDERLPEEHICDDGYIEPSKSVLVTMKSGLMRVSRYWGSKDKECPWIDLSYPTTEEVLAWMPLPEPYNAEIECE